MHHCVKCCGLLSTGYDISLREEYVYCINCGARPNWEIRRADGRPLNAPILCRRCKEHPVTSVKLPIKGEIWTELCQFCRVVHLANRRAKKHGYTLEKV